VQEAYAHPKIISEIARSLNTPHLQTRKTILDVLTFFIHERDFQALPLVVDALTTLSIENDETPTPYAYWFKSMEQSLGASNGIRRTDSPDSLTHDYAVCALVLEGTVRSFIRF